MSFSPIVGLRASSHRYAHVSTPSEMPPELISAPQREVKRPFYFEDSQIVLRASHSITMLPSTI